MGISVSRPAGSRNDARSTEPGKLLCRYTRPKGECTAKCRLCTCTPVCTCTQTDGVLRRSGGTRTILYRSNTYSERRRRWRRLLRSSSLPTTGLRCLLSLLSHRRLPRSFSGSLSPNAPDSFNLCEPETHNGERTLRGGTERNSGREFALR